MAIEYQRTMKIRYEHDERLNQKNEAKLAQQLQKKGLIMIDSYWSKKPKFGYTPITEKIVCYHILIDDEYIFDVEYNHTACEIVEGLSNKFDNVRREMVKTEITKKDWVSPKGDYLVPDFDKNGWADAKPNDDSLFDFSSLSNSTCRMGLDNGVDMMFRLQNNHGGMDLIIKTFWTVDKVQRKEIIEEHMVAFPLEIVGKVQSAVEKVLKTKQFGYDVENVEIDCNFKTLTLNESKCTPDIVRMTREARNQ